MAAALIVLGAAWMVAASQPRYDDVVRNLRNPDPKTRLAAVKLLREAKHADAIVPLSALINDPLDPIQLEAIATELSFFLVEDIPQRRRVAFIEVRSQGAAATAFDLGPLAVWPRTPPPESREVVASSPTNRSMRRPMHACPHGRL